MSQEQQFGQEANQEKFGVFSATSPSEGHPNHNEDRVFADPIRKESAVCDGMGGQANGELAASVAIEQLQKSLKDIPDVATPVEVGQLVKQAIENANKAVFIASENEKKKAGNRTGATINVLKIVEKTEGGKLAIIGNLGDSPVFHIDAEGKLTQVTVDDNGVYVSAVGRAMNSLYGAGGRALEWIKTEPEKLLRENQGQLEALSLSMPLLDPLFLRKAIFEKAREIESDPRRRINFGSLGLDPATNTRQFYIRVAIEAEIAAREKQRATGNLKTKSEYNMLPFEEQVSFDARNQISKAAGLEKNAVPRIDAVNLGPGESLLQVSDGISDVLTHEEIRATVMLARKSGADPLPLLIQQAKERNSHEDTELRAKSDDKTGVYFEYGGKAEKIPQQQKPTEAEQPKLVEIKPMSELAAQDGKKWKIGPIDERTGEYSLYEDTGESRPRQIFNKTALRIQKELFPDAARRLYKPGITPREFAAGEPVVIKRGNGAIETWYSSGQYESEKGGALTVYDKWPIETAGHSKPIDPIEAQTFNERYDERMDFSKARSVYEIPEMVSRMGGIPGSQKFYEPVEIDQIIVDLARSTVEKVNTGQATGKYDLDFLPSTAGLRDSVGNLLREARLEAEKKKAQSIKSSIQGS